MSLFKTRNNKGCIMFGIIAAGIIGVILGSFVTTWFVFGNRLRTNARVYERIEDDFSERGAGWTYLTIGNSEVQLLDDPDEPGNRFARLLVNSAADDQLALAQIDDYTYRSHADYLWNPPLSVEVRMRSSHQNLPGTAGLYLWNNPFDLGSELGELRPLRWLGFYQIPETANYTLTGISTGYRASVANGTWASLLNMFGASFLPELDANEVLLDEQNDLTDWHVYRIEWRTESVQLWLDDVQILETQTRIEGPLALAIWYDNNQPYVDNGQFEQRFDAFEEAHWLDVDYINIRPLDED